MMMECCESALKEENLPVERENDIVEEKAKDINPTQSGNLKKKRKRRIRKDVSKDDVASGTESPSQSESRKNSVGMVKTQSMEDPAGSPSKGKKLDQECHAKDGVKYVKKGRNFKKKAASGSNAKQIPSMQAPALNSMQPMSPNSTPPKHLRKIPAGIQPLNYVRQSPKEKQDSPKQDKFLPYWTVQQVEAGLKYGTLISGIIRINPRNYQKAYITPADDEDSKDVLIDGLIDRNRALEGDEVAVKLFDESKWQAYENGDEEQGLQKTGMVVHILAKNHNRCTVGYLKLVNQAAKSTPARSGKKLKEADSSLNCSPSSQSPNIKPTMDNQANQSSSSSILECDKTPPGGESAPYKLPGKVLFSPRDARMPRMWVKTSQLPSGSPSDLNPNNCMNHLFLACIEEWNTQPIANGKLLTYIGEADEVDTETVALLLEHGLDVTPYPKNIFTLPPLPFEIPEKELKERMDLRGSLIFTIDPETAKDLDDALSVKELGNGLLEVGVHIADPSFFLEENSPLDLLVRERATSIYLVQNVFHMLPKELCLLCSLLPGEDKLAFSLIMTVDTKTWKVISHKFSRSIVNSSAQLSYDHAQAFIKDPGCISTNIKNFPAVHNGYTLEDLCRAVNLIWPFSAALRERRFSNGLNDEFYENESEIDGNDLEYKGGALKINQPKLCFKLDAETCMPQEVFLYENKESNNLIEELMLLANILTAQRLASMFPKHAFLRRHCRPKMRMLNNLSQVLMRYGIHLDTSASGALNASLERYGSSDIEPMKDLEIDSSIILSTSFDESLLTRSEIEPIKDSETDSSIILSTSCNESHLTKCKNGDEYENPTDSSIGISVLSSEDAVLEIQQEKIISESISSSVSVSEVQENFKTLLIRENKNTSILEDKDKFFGSSCSSNTQCISDSLDSSLEKKLKDTGDNANCTLSPQKVPSEEELSLARGLVLNHLCAKPMMRAEYFCYGAKSEKSARGNLQNTEEVKVYTHHYALNVPLYTHFTSPIRRYADIMVHRLLAASLGYQSLPQLDPQSIQSIASNCNKQKYGAKKASDASNELFFRLWVRLQVEKNGCFEGARNVETTKMGDLEERRSEGGLRETAVVVNAKDYSFDAILLRFGVVVRVYVNKLPAAVKHLKRHGSSVISIRWFKPGEKAVSFDSPVQDITTFSIVRLEIYYSYTVRRIRAELLNPFAP